MGRPFKHETTKVQSQKGARKANRQIAERKRLAEIKESGTLPDEVKNVSTTSASEQKSPVVVRRNYWCPSDPGDVKMRGPGDAVPYCRYCGRQMVPGRSFGP